MGFCSTLIKTINCSDSLPLLMWINYARQVLWALLALELTINKNNSLSWDFYSFLRCSLACHNLIYTNIFPKGFLQNSRMESPTKEQSSLVLWVVLPKLSPPTYRHRSCVYTKVLITAVNNFAYLAFPNLA